MSISNQVPVVVAALLLLTVTNFAQRNNPFSANPDVRLIGSAKRAEPQSAGTSQPTALAEARSTAPSQDPTQVYKVAAGDTLYVVLGNAPNAAGYYSVRSDGTIDFPLAGENISVRGMTAAEVEQTLASHITLYRDVQISVTVHEFASHKITVSGLVERNGERFLQRESMPLFTIKADVGVRSGATVVVVTRSSGAIEIYKLGDPRTDDILITVGDAIEFRG